MLYILLKIKFSNPLLNTMNIVLNSKSNYFKIFTTIIFCLFLSTWTFGQKEIEQVKDLTHLIPNQPGETLRFQFGSCALYTPKKFKGPSKRIYKSMLENNADFMIWLGDYTYYLGEKHWGTYESMINRYIEQRTAPNLDTFMNSRHQYAIWDDHDYGPNDSDGSFPGKENALKVFKQHWNNPYYGLDELPGVFCNFQHSDAEFFLLDGRYHCKKWNHMLGQAQMDWLKEKLHNSTATFKFICTGSQVINDTKKGETFNRYPEEKKELLDFLKKKNITGVIFLTGDRHFAEVSKLEREGTYPLYDFTSSSITSLYFPVYLKNSFRVKNSFYTKRNFGRVTIQGPEGDRSCTMELFNKNGGLVWSYYLSEHQLK